MNNVMPKEQYRILSLRLSHYYLLKVLNFYKNKKTDFRRFFCRGEKTRTSDPLHPMQVR